MRLLPPPREACLLLCLSLTSVLPAPQVFEDYFSEDIRDISVPIEKSIEICVESGASVVEKFNAATRTCYGSDKTLDAGDLTSLNSNAPDGTLGTRFKNAEVCFMEEMDFIDMSTKEIVKQKVLEKFDFMDSTINSIFDTRVGQCITWNGDINSRRRRDLSGLVQGGMMTSVRERMRHRERRQAPKNGKAKSKSDGKFAKKSVQGRKENPKVGPQPKVKTGKTGNIIRSKGKKEKKKRKNLKKQPKKKVPGTQLGRTETLLVSEEMYKKLWCLDLTIAQFLGKCINNKLDQL